MAEEVFMDIPAVRDVSSKMSELGDNLHRINKTMEAALIALKASAFVGLYGNYALAQYLEQIQPHVERYAELCTEMGGDLSESVSAYERGDAAGKTRFY